MRLLSRNKSSSNVTAGDNAPSSSKGASTTASSALELLGPGPMRFAPAEEVPSPQAVVRERIESLAPDQLACYQSLQNKWSQRYPGRKNWFSDDMVLRFAANSPGPSPFNEKTAWKVMKKFNPRYLHLTAGTMEHQLLSKVGFPVPGLSSDDGDSVCYVRPSRYSPKKTPVDVMMDHLSYILMQTSYLAASNKGIVVLMNMQDWTMQNFATDYWFQLLAMLQGNRVPVRVSAVLFLNPPPFFNSVWNMMQPMMTEYFRANVVRRCEDVSDLDGYFTQTQSYRELLPDELQGGHALTYQLVVDFVAYRNHAEEDQEQRQFDYDYADCSCSQSTTTRTTTTYHSDGDSWLLGSNKSSLHSSSSSSRSLGNRPNASQGSNMNNGTKKVHWGSEEPGLTPTPQTEKRNFLPGFLQHHRKS